MAVDITRPQPGDPEHLKLAFGYLGLAEIVGSEDEPKILGMFSAVGHPEILDDETAWCAAFVGYVLKQAGLRGTGALNAQSYLRWGEASDGAPRRGDVVVIKRGTKAWQGHVFFYLGTRGKRIVGLGGNQGNKVSVASFDATALLGVRRATGSGAPLTPALSPEGRGSAAEDEARKRLIMALQQALVDKGYHEVGEVDGRMGSRTRGAILAFEADNDLPREGEATTQLLAAVLSAAPRPVGLERATGKPDLVAVKGATPVVATATTVAGTGAVALGGDFIDQVEQGAGWVARIKAAVAPLLDFGAHTWPLFALAAGVVIVVIVVKARREAVAGYRDGRVVR